MAEQIENTSTPWVVRDVPMTTRLFVKGYAGYRGITMAQALEELVDTANKYNGLRQELKKRNLREADMIAWVQQHPVDQRSEAYTTMPSWMQPKSKDANEDEGAGDES